MKIRIPYSKYKFSISKQKQKPPNEKEYTGNLNHRLLVVCQDDLPTSL